MKGIILAGGKGTRLYPTIAVSKQLLLYKRLDNGRFQWPRNETEALLLTPQQIRWLLEGLKIEQPKAIRKGKPGAMY